MKTLFKNIWMLGAMILLLSACKKDQTLVKANTTNAKAPVLSTSYEDLVLKEDDASADAIEFKWDKADYGYSAAVSYSIEIGKKDSAFVNSKSIGVGNGTSSIMTVGALNTAVNQMNAVGFAENPLEVRIKAEIGGGVAPVYSNVVAIVVTPYLDAPPYQTLYIVGDATDGGWDNKTATPIYRDPNDAFKFTYTGYFKAGYFKLLGQRGAWAPMWGSNGTGTAQFRAKESDPDPGSYQIVTAGYYTVTLSLKNNAFTMAPYNASGAKTYPSLGIIGPFTGWSSVLPMTKSGIDPHKWSIEHTFTGDASTEFKIRIPEGWDTNWGANGKDKEANLYGIASPGGANFLRAPGKYMIVFDDLTAGYVFIKLD